MRTVTISIPSGGNPVFVVPFDGRLKRVLISKQDATANDTVTVVLGTDLMGQALPVISGNAIQGVITQTEFGTTDLGKVVVEVDIPVLDSSVMAVANVTATVELIFEIK